MNFIHAALAASLAGLATGQLDANGQLNIPKRVGDVIHLKHYQTVSQDTDFGFYEYDRDMDCDPSHDTGTINAVFLVLDGVTISNLIISGRNWEGIHCQKSCTLQNVYFRSVCEDAITCLGAGTVNIIGGGAQNAQDKVVQLDGRCKVKFDGFTVVNVGKMARSCGDCTNNGGPRYISVNNVQAYGVNASLVGINYNYGDKAEIDNSCGAAVKVVCQEFEGVQKSEHRASPIVNTLKDCLGSQGKLGRQGLPPCHQAEDPSALSLNPNSPAGFSCPMGLPC